MSDLLYPKLSDKLKAADLPDQLDFITNSLGVLLDRILIKQSITNVDTYSNCISYCYKLGYQNGGQETPIHLKIPGTELVLALNKNPNGGASEFSISVLVDKKAIGLLGDICSASQLSTNIADYFDPLLKYLKLTGADFLYTMALSEDIIAGCDNFERISAILLKIQEYYPLNLTPAQLDERDTWGNVIKIVRAIEDLNEDDLEVIYQVFILHNNDAVKTIRILLQQYTGNDIMQYLRDILIPYIEAHALFQPAVEIPRSILIPAQNDDGTRKVNVLFGQTEVYFSTEGGFGMDSDMSVSMEKALIANTGFSIEITRAKFDLSPTTNIEEAMMDNRPEDFVGLYAERAVIGLPPNWFSCPSMQLVGENILIGTGGFSGTIGMETVGDTLWANIGGENGFRVGFNAFSVTFKQNAVTASNIQGVLEIPKFEDRNGNPLRIGVLGHISGDGDFNLTASIGGGVQASLFNFVNFNFLTFELGKEENHFYLGTSCEVWFDNDAMKRLVGDQKIALPKIRIYDNGRMEIVGGTAFIPTNINLKLGPVDVSVTGVNFGSHQGTYEGVERQYNYWGFDGAISIDPLGVDVRGEGLKYYYTVDGGEGHSFIHIQTLEVDLIIPGTASAAEAMVIIHGMLSIPKPGEEPKEYQGEISLKLPKAKIAARAGMRAIPKMPAFIIDTELDLPAPIPIGPVGIYGFRGLLGYRYIAEKEAVGLVTGVDTWYDYYVYPKRGIHISKFRVPEQTKNYDFAFSLGVGAVLATSFDSGNIISVRVMLALSLPSLFIIDGRASIVSARLGLDDTKEPPFFASVAWGDNTIEAFMGADLKIPQDSGNVFTILARVENRFPFKNPSGWYMNMGTKENPVTAMVFKDVLDLKAQSFLMLSAAGIDSGARVGFNLSKNFFGVNVRLHSFIEVGGRISFERPQLGGYLHMGGGIDVNVFKLIYVGFDLDAYLSAEAAKPFKIYARLTFTAELKILFVSKTFDIDLELKWVKDETVDGNPIPALPSPEYHGSGGAIRTHELVKAVHMQTNEAFDLDYFPEEPSSADITKIIPVDSYIDIKSTKGLINNLSGKIGGGLIAASNFMDKIPPLERSRGKAAFRQIKHHYSAEAVGIYAWTGSGWMPYHPFKALAEAGEEREKAGKLRIGTWQLVNNQYDTIRLLATNPFSYLDAGEPGWHTPEYYGITAATLFCKIEEPVMKTINFLNKEIEKTTGILYHYNYTHHHYINEVYFNLAEKYPCETLLQNDNIAVNTFVVRETDAETHHGFGKSLCFLNYNRLVIILPESSVKVNLQLTSGAPVVTIRYYKCCPTDDGFDVKYEEVHAETKTRAQLAVETVGYENPENPVMKIVIEPQQPVFDQIAEVEAEIQALFAQVYERTAGVVTLTLEEEEIYWRLMAKQDELKSIGCVGSKCFICTTCLQEVGWMSVDDYEYSIHIPDCEAKKADQEGMQEAVDKTVQPIWRPETKYYIHFRLKDRVTFMNADLNLNLNVGTKEYDYYYGFKTSGGVGHYKGNEYGETKEGIERTERESKTYNSFEKYIDYKRSYPNADGNLLQSKPLFWGNGECKINLFFTKPSTYHMLNNWPEYDGLSGLKGAINIKIKDPVSEILIQYPLRPEETGDTVPVPEGNGENGSVWVKDDEPQLPPSIQLLNNMIENGEIPCTLILETLSPLGNAYSVKLTCLKPLKLYTALLYNAFKFDGADKLTDADNVEIHRFVFQTSRYKSFEDQVNSYLLKDENGNMKKAAFELLTEIQPEKETDVYNMVWKVDTDVLPDLSSKYSHRFDKLLEGVFLFKPLEFAATTEFNFIRNSSTGNILAILVRNPEPFNDPKMPLNEVADTIAVVSENDCIDGQFRTLYSKDYSQAIITKGDMPITEGELTIRFLYKLWNGSTYNREACIHVDININR